VARTRHDLHRTTDLEAEHTMKRWMKWTIIGVVAAVVLFFGAVFVYAKFINDAPAKLSFDDRADQTVATTSAETATTIGGTTDDPTTTAASSGGALDASSVDGTWNATTDSQVGYRVKENLFGVDTDAVGRTNQVTGMLTIEGASATAAEFSVDMTSVTSDEGRRDAQFNGRIMETDQFPTATFELTEPIDFGSVPAAGGSVKASATGDLTLHGVTKSVAFDVEARINGANVEVLGNIPVVFADYGIDNPSTAGISTEDNGTLEFLLVFAKG
jgi:polyisoprenoid-binding protein YceI